MKYGVIAERELPTTDAGKVIAIIDMIEELLGKTIPTFKNVRIIVSEDPFKLRVGMKWEQERRE